MIVKSMSRKEASFGQLIEYIDRDDEERYRIRYNVFGRDREHIAKEFKENSTLMPKRKNGVFLYHEIVSLTRSTKIPLDEQKELLQQIVQEYIAMRCPQNMCFGNLHDDKDHSIHYHLMISANECGEDKRHRLSKAQFKDIQTALEAHVLKNYPKLEQKVAINKQANEKLTQKGAELKRRTGETPKRDEIVSQLRETFSEARSKDDLRSLLQKQGFSIYVRGKTVGVIDTSSDRKYRLKTIGLVEAYETLNDHQEQIKEPSPKEKVQKKSVDDVKQKSEKQKQSKKPEQKTSTVKNDQTEMLKKKETVERLKNIREYRSRNNADTSSKSDKHKR